MVTYRWATMIRLRNFTWTQSVPPAVAGGYVVDTLDLLRFSWACTHPLPQVVLTVSKYLLD